MKKSDDTYPIIDNVFHEKLVEWMTEGDFMACCKSESAAKKSSPNSHWRYFVPLSFFCQKLTKDMAHQGIIL